jgi:hypothetical protein
MSRADEFGDRPGSNGSNLHEAWKAYEIYNSTSTTLVNSLPSHAQDTLLFMRHVEYDSAK